MCCVDPVQNAGKTVAEKARSFFKLGVGQLAETRNRFEGRQRICRHGVDDESGAIERFAKDLTELRVGLLDTE